jgi:hypothetical protein
MNNRKKIAVCGASWFTSDLDYPGLSFGEKLANKVDFDLVSLARGGCSNFTIALQIDKAIELGVDYVVVGTTTWDRIELPIINSNNQTLITWIRNKFNFKNWLRTQPGYYKPDRGISNIQYSPHPDLSSKHEFLTDPTLISESLGNLAFPDNKVNNFYKLNDEQVSAIKLYMLNLYDSRVKRQQDCWIISDACRRLQQHQIPFIVFVDPLFVHAHEKNISWLPPNYKVDVQEFNYRALVVLNSTANARFHYDPSNSDIFADFVIKKLNLTEDSKPQ